MDNEQTQPQPSGVERSAEMTAQQEQNEPTVEISHVMTQLLQTAKRSEAELQDTVQELKNMQEQRKEDEYKIEELTNAGKETQDELCQTLSSLKDSMERELEVVPLEPLPNAQTVWFKLANKEDLPEIQPVSKREEVRIKGLMDSKFAYKLHLGGNGKRGRAIVFHNEKVKGVHDRKGNEHDVAALKHVFESDLLQFEFQEYSQKDEKDVKAILKKEAERKELEDIDVLFIFFMSHGSKGCVWAADRGTITISEILDAFDSNKCELMKDNPKAVFIQACQEEDKPIQSSGQSDGGSVKQVHTPPTKDEEEARMHRKHFVRSVAAYPDAAAWRIEEHGTFYIQALCYVISRYAHQFHLAEILTQTVALVNNHEYDYCLLPVTESTFDKAVFLCPGL